MKELKFKDEFFDLILEGKKTQTRRPIKPQPKGIDAFRKGLVNEAWQAGFVDIECPYGEVGNVGTIGDIVIKDIRIERLQDISVDDIRAEGVIQRFPNINDRFTPQILLGSFMEMWNDIYFETEFSFQSNPWVWVIEFSLFK